MSASAPYETPVVSLDAMEKVSSGEDFQARMFASSQLKVLHPVEPVTLVWKDLKVTVRVPPTHPTTGQPLRSTPCKKHPLITKTILNKISGSAGPGELIAVLGASGAGKTTLVDVLAGRVDYSGSYTMNGQDVSAELVRKKSAYVQQEDMFFPYLTVREHLWFQAQLRLPSTMPQEEKDARVTELITKLGLDKVASTQIGFMSAQSGRRGISGGERKRLAFAAEVLMDPSVLFADEPTSGLDAFMAESVVRQLQTLAQAGRCIISTIHQPSTDVYGLFSKIMLLSEGKVVYFGPTAHVINYFNGLGYPCPTYSNPADFFIKMLATVKDGGESEARVQLLRDAWDQYMASDTNPIKDFGPNHLVTANSAEWAAWRWFAQYRPAAPNKPSGEEGSIVAPPTFGSELRVAECTSEWPPKPVHELDSSKFFQRASGFANQWMTEATVLYKRSTINLARDPLLTRARFFSTVFPAVLMGLIFLGLTDNQRSIQGKIGGLFFCIMNQAMISLFGVLQSFPVERAMFVREVQNGYYRVSTYYLSKTVSDIPFQVVFPIVFVTIVYWMMDLRDDAARYFAILGFIILCANCAISMGFFVAAVSPNINVSMALGPMLIFPQVMFCGFLLNTASIPIGLRWFEAISFFKYAFHNCMYFLWHDVPLVCTSEDLKQNSGVCRFPNGNKVIEFYNVEDTVGTYAGALCAILVCWRILAYLALWSKSRKAVGKRIPE